jgi:choline dehydrogenase-like flavoprotein
VVVAGGNPPYPMMGNGVAGMIHWDAHFPRFHPSDFRARSLDGVADDWPVRYEDLEPYYDLNDRELGVAGAAGDPANPPRLPRPTPSLPVGVMGETIGRGFEKLGWHWWCPTLPSHPVITMDARLAKCTASVCLAAPSVRRQQQTSRIGQRR